MPKSSPKNSIKDDHNVGLTSHSLKRFLCHLANKEERMQDLKSYSLSNSVSKFPKSPPNTSSCWWRQSVDAPTQTPTS